MLNASFLKHSKITAYFLKASKRREITARFLKASKKGESVRSKINVLLRNVVCLVFKEWRLKYQYVHEQLHDCIKVVHNATHKFTNVANVKFVASEINTLKTCC